MSRASGRVVRIRKGVYDLLKRLQEQQGFSSIEDVMEALVLDLEKAGIPDDMFGVDRASSAGSLGRTVRRTGNGGPRGTYA